MRARLIALTLVPIAALLTVAACTIVDTLKVPSEVADASDGGTVTGMDMDGSPCGRFGYPDPPATFATGDDIEVRTAVSELDFGSFDGGPIESVGYNLDLVCTCPQAQSCTVSKAGTMNCDDPGNGTDNNVAKLVNGTAKVDGLDIVGNAQRSLAFARNGILLRLSQYNGMPDDSTVTLSLYASGGPTTPTDDGSAGTPVNPTFTKSDLWTVDKNGLVPGASPSIYAALVTTSAYVSGGTVVARDLSFVLRLDETILVTLDNAAITAKIVKKGSDFYFEDGRIVGRWPVVEALRSLGTLTPPGMDAGRVCDDPSMYTPFKQLLCDSADISSTGPDNQGRICDAISFGLRFKAVPATFGPLVDLTPTVVPCTDPEAGSDFYVCN
jgi:hypothetical protein